MLESLADQVRQRGMVIIISDLLTDLPAFYDGLARLQYRGHEILVLQVLDSDELDLPFNDLTLFHDIEGTEELYAEPWGFRKAYQAAMQTFLAEVRTTCGQRGIDHLLLRTDEDLAGAELLSARPRAVRTSAVWEIDDGQSQFPQSDAVVGAGAGVDSADYPLAVSPQVSPRRLVRRCAI